MTFDEPREINDGVIGIMSVELFETSILDILWVDSSD